MKIRVFWDTWFWGFWRYGPPVPGWVISLGPFRLCKWNLGA